MCRVKSRSVAPTSSNRSMTRRYSYDVVRRPAMPRCQPSTSASEKVHAADAAHTAGSSRRHRSRSATPGPYVMTSTATAIAAGVPGPTWGSQWAYRGAQSTYRLP